MARGDLTLFEEWLVDDGEGDVHDYESDTFKLALIVGTGGAGVDPTAADATPMWSVGSGVDYDGNEVSDAGAVYVTGGLTLANPTHSEAAGVATFNADDPAVITQDAAGFTDAYWGIIYNDTATNKNAIAFLDMGGPVSQVAGPITITLHASGIWTKTIT